MEQLNKTQLVLLALLVSFVSSIATGIVMIKLTENSPQPITQTINRVIEKTIERVAPERSTSIVTKIIKEEELIVAAIEKNNGSVVKIKTDVDLEKNNPGTLLGYGFVFSGSERLVVTDLSIVLDADIPYVAELPDGSNVRLEREYASQSGIAVMKMIFAVTDKAQLFPELTLSSDGAIKVGQTVIGLADSVSTGLISGVIFEKDNGVATTTGSAEIYKTHISAIKTNITTVKETGWLLVNLEGNIVGVAISKDKTQFVIPASYISTAVKASKNAGVAKNNEVPTRIQ
jgi:hypothetical protein